MNKIKTIFLVLLLSYFPYTFSQLTENNYRIYSVKQAKEVNLQTIVDDMENYHVLFFGEEHNDSVTHFLENRILELLHQKYGDKVTLSMEMFDRDVQPVMNEYLTSDIREKHFRKDARAWSNYKDYRPMIEFAKKNSMDVVCANAASRYTNLAGRKGQQALMALPKASKPFFAPLPYDTATGPYYEKLTGLTNHTSPTDTGKKTIAPAISGMGGFSLITAQSLWDATMAYSIADYLKKNKGQIVLHLNGKFHSDEGFGIVTQLKKYNSRIKPLIISTASDDSFPVINWETYKKSGDYIIITDPSIPRTYEQ